MFPIPLAAEANESAVAPDLAGHGNARREFLNLLRFLGNELKIPLVGVDTRDAYLAIRSDDQLENRFAPFVPPRWQADKEACKLLASFAASFPLRRPSQMATTEMADYLLTRSESTIGELTALLTDQPCRPSGTPPACSRYPGETPGRTAARR